ncbi:serine/threonine-protein kinase BSK1-like [Malus sylvestris]|uniref:serine/threonine-protein kinase BSK1-like n=1 Tax=Malus sylvestris TaxID=3752 RepID=UPI0021ACC411|nr:serine/threonine-protein kinase BSK1-like [Malus sylvestris]
MCCCESKVSENQQPEKIQTQHLAHNSQTTTHHTNPTSESNPETGGSPPFSEFSFADLKAATNNFSSDYIVSESGEKTPNLVYKGRLQNRCWIAVKKFTKMAWPDPKQFALGVWRSYGVGGLRI